MPSRSWLAQPGFRTDDAVAAEREYLSQLAEFDLLDDTVVSYESIIDETMEIVGYEPNMIRIRHCRHADETYGQFGLQLL